MPGSLTSASRNSNWLAPVATMMRASPCSAIALRILSDAVSAAFDELFVQRPFDVGGSMAYRWHCTLKRLASCDPHAVAEKLAREIDG